MDNEETRRLLQNQSSQQSTSEEEWSDESSEESYYSDSDSSVPEWESSIVPSTGHLLYIDCHPFVTQNLPPAPPPAPPPFTKDQLRRSTRGKFLRLIRRRDSQRRSRRHRPNTTIDSTPGPVTSKVKFRDSQEGEEKEVVLRIRKVELSGGRRGTAGAESLLGISLGTLSDGVRLMVAGFLPDSEAKNDKNVKIGDWLKSVNDIPVTNQNVNSVLDRLMDRSEVLLKLQRVAGVEVTKDPPINEINCQSRFVRELIELSTEEHETFISKLKRIPIGIIFLNTDKLSESNLGFDDVNFCYPPSLQTTSICQSRGIFLTLNHLINDITKTKVHLSSLLHSNQLTHVTYHSENQNLLLFMLPDSHITAKVATFMTQQLIQMLNFLYDNLDNAFHDQNKSQIEHFFARFFTKLLNGNKWTTTDQINTKTAIPTLECFEQVLAGAPTVPLPNEAFMQVDDALTELEASDYRDWNEEPLDCQRLFTILGSALYHDGYLLISHLMYEDLIDVHIFLRENGFFHLSSTEPVKTLLVWREVHPRSCRKQKVPDGKRYLLVVGSRKDLLATIMESGGCTEPPEPNAAPDAFYVEEAQATLAHVQEMGVPELIDRWLATNPGAQVVAPGAALGRGRKGSMSSGGQKRPEVTSILKRRGSDQVAVAEEVSERRSYDSGDDESDMDDYGDGSQSNSSFDMSELRQTILSETEDIEPQQLATGKENVLFHFVQFDATEGVLVIPPESRVHSATLDSILEGFQQTCHKIHSLFVNTMRFKNMPAQDMAKSVMNKSLIAIKEHGVMFECPIQDEVDNKKSKLKYWVIGRLFYMPHPREVYVCYEDSIPQNIIELAFKIDLSTMN